MDTVKRSQGGTKQVFTSFVANESPGQVRCSICTIVGDN